jgi:transposase-like protein
VRLGAVDATAELEYGDALSLFTEVLEAEMTEALGAEKGERTAGRLGYRSGGRF